MASWTHESQIGRVQAVNETVEVRFSPERRRFEASIPGSAELAVLDVRAEGEVWALTHTGVPSEFEGRGIGGELVRQALEHAREIGVQVSPLCPFTAVWIRRNPGYRDLVHADSLHLVER